MSLELADPRLRGHAIRRIVYSAHEIAARVKELGAEITRAYPDGELLVLGLLKGSFIFTSDLVRVYSWQIFLSDNGIINALLAQVGLGPFGMLNSVFGTMVGYLTLSFPLLVLLQLFSLIFVDRTLVEAAHNLRCGRLRTVFEVVVPSARVGLVIAALFCFILTFGDFVSPLYLGGGDPPTLSILITDTTKSGQQWPRAAVIALVMIATLLAVAFAAVGYAYRERGK